MAGRFNIEEQFDRLGLNVENHDDGVLIVDIDDQKNL